MKKLHIFYVFVLFLFIANSCSKEGSDFNSTTGTAGSLARFAVVDDYLYTVSSESMNVFDISTDSKPFLKSEIWLGWGIETIFPQDSLLFLGANDGMHIYNISNPEQPNFISTYSHIVSCDPVVVEGDKAYVTLHSSVGSAWCGISVNELHIIDISDITFPTLINSYPMTMPLGLGVKGNELFLCDAGLKIYDVEDPFNIQLLHQFNISANDVIILENNLMVVGDDGLYQYSYNGEVIEFLSKLEICSSNLIP